MISKANPNKIQVLFDQLSTYTFEALRLLTYRCR